jgi:hypothetical protein
MSNGRIARTRPQFQFQNWLALASMSALALANSAPAAAQALTITNGDNFVAYATVGVPLWAQLNATGGKPPYTWSWTVAEVGEGNILAPGLSLNASTGLISGIPTSNGANSYDFAATVKDSAGASNTKAFNLNILGIPCPTTGNIRTSGALRPSAITTCLSITPSPIMLSITAGTKQTFSAAAQVTSQNTPSAGVVVQSSGTSWLNVNTALSITASTASLNLTVDATQLAAGTEYTATLTFQCAGTTTCQPTTDSVVLTVTSATPAGCTYNVNPPAAALQISGGAGSFSVGTQTGCATATLVDDSWIHISSTNLSGGGNITYTVDPNTGSSGRASVVGITNSTGTLVGTYPITQAGVAASTAGLTFVSLPPCRVMETRLGQNIGVQTGSFGPPSLNAGETRTLNMLQQTACSMPAAAKAYVVNATLIPHVPGNTNNVTIYPADEVRPRYSTIGGPDGNIVANGAIIRAGAAPNGTAGVGAINVFSTDPADLLIDIAGYFTDNRTVSNLVFYPLAPCRVVETRASYRPAGAFGGPSMAAAETRQYRFPASPDCPIPSGAAGYSTTVTVVPKTTLSYLTAWQGPAGVPQPTASIINSFDGRVVPNSVIIPAGSDGSIQIFTSDATDFFIDINGYFAPDNGTGLSYFPVTQCTAADSSDPLYGGAFGGPEYPGGSRTLPVPTSPFCASIPSTAKGYAVDMTANPHGAGLVYATLYPTAPGDVPPNASNLNDYQGQIVTNSAMVPAGTNGSIDVFAAGATDIKLMVSGYFSR